MPKNNPLNGLAGGHLNRVVILFFNAAIAARHPLASRVVENQPGRST
jgi:hypothetical protein